jgi:hypothetical protein
MTISVGPLFFEVLLDVKLFCDRVLYKHSDFDDRKPAVVQRGLACLDCLAFEGL